MMRSKLSRRKLLSGAAATMAAVPAYALSGSTTNDPADANRKGSIARIVTTCQNGERHSTVEGNRDQMLALFDRALKQKPDLVCFPETFTGVGVEGKTPQQVAETVPGSELLAVQQAIATRQQDVIAGQQDLYERSLALRQLAGLEIGPDAIAVRTT